MTELEVLSTKIDALSEKLDQNIALLKQEIDLNTQRINLNKEEMETRIEVYRNATAAQLNISIGVLATASVSLIVGVVLAALTN